MSKYRSAHQRYMNATASLSDVLLASQLPAKQNEHTKPEQKLHRAVFYDALACIDKIMRVNVPPPMKKTAHNYHKRNVWDIALEAYHWLFHEEGLITCEQACFAAGIDLDYLRDHVRKYVKRYGKLEFFQGNEKG